MKCLRQYYSCSQRVVGTSLTLIGEGLDKQETMGLDYNTGLRRSSLRLDIQDDTVFILSLSEHGPSHGTYWKVMEG